MWQTGAPPGVFGGRVCCKNSGRSEGAPTLAKTNYTFEKRQRELARKKKQEEKRQRKTSRPEPAGTPPTENGAVPAPVTQPEKTD